MGDEIEQESSVPASKPLLSIGVVVMVLCWVAAGALLIAYSEHYKLMDQGWRVQYSVTVTVILALSACAVAFVVSLATRLMPASIWRPNFPMLSTTFFVLFVVNFLMGEYPKDNADKARRDELNYWEQHTEYQACLKARQRRMLRSAFAEAECKRLFSRK